MLFFISCLLLLAAHAKEDLMISYELHADSFCGNHNPSDVLMPNKGETKAQLLDRCQAHCNELTKKCVAVRIVTKGGKVKCNYEDSCTPKADPKAKGTSQIYMKHYSKKVTVYEAIEKSYCQNKNKDDTFYAEEGETIDKLVQRCQAHCTSLGDECIAARVDATKKLKCNFEDKCTPRPAKNSKSTIYMKKVKIIQLMSAQQFSEREMAVGDSEEDVGFIIRGLIRGAVGIVGAALALTAGVARIAIGAGLVVVGGALDIAATATKLGLTVVGGVIVLGVALEIAKWQAAFLLARGLLRVTVGAIIGGIRIADIIMDGKIGIPYDCFGKMIIDIHCGIEETTQVQNAYKCPRGYTQRGTLSRNNDVGLGYLTQTFVRNINKCKKRCDKDKNCASFMFDNDDGRCLTSGHSEPNTSFGSTYRFCSRNGFNVICPGTNVIDFGIDAAGKVAGAGLGVAAAGIGVLGGLLGAGMHVAGALTGAALLGAAGLAGGALHVAGGIVGGALSLASTLDYTLPCFMLSKGACCGHADPRPFFRWQPCVTSKSRDGKFRSGRECEPLSWAEKNDATKIDYSCKYAKQKPIINSACFRLSSFECSLHADNRKPFGFIFKHGPDYYGQPCIVAKEGLKFSSGNMCEPQSWITKPQDFALIGQPSVYRISEGRCVDMGCFNIWDSKTCDDASRALWDEQFHKDLRENGIFGLGILNIRGGLRAYNDYNGIQGCWIEKNSKVHLNVGRKNYQSIAQRKMYPIGDDSNYHICRCENPAPCPPPAPVEKTCEQYCDSSVHEPVCSIMDEQYQNRCLLDCAGDIEQYEGPCHNTAVGKAQAFARNHSNLLMFGLVLMSSAVGYYVAINKKKFNYSKLMGGSVEDKPLAVELSYQTA